MKISYALAALALLVGLPGAHAVPPAPQALPDSPPAEKSDDTAGEPLDFTAADKAAEGLKPASGLKVVAFANEQQLANPVAFCTDAQGRFWIAETFRFDSSSQEGDEGVYDIRHMMDRLDDDLAMRTVEDRLTAVKKWLGGDLSSLTKQSDRVRLVEDTDGDGKADRSTVFADGFNGAMDGLAAGILVRDGDVYFSEIPSLYLLRDTDGDRRADEKNVLSTGYGVRYNLLGHDLHGLIWGPDGRLYFSIGDRGSHVVTKEGKTLANPDSGTIFRCDPDGSNLEVFATGLRNPQELAFDEHGNLFTGDNNCDHGDPARFVYVMEGADIGWRVGYQHADKPYDGGPWMSEKLYEVGHENTGYYNLPPVGHIASGPSGLAYDPGTGLGSKYRNNFYLCDFRGGGPTSQVHAFTLKPKGAGYAINKTNTLVERTAVTDVVLGNDGAIYVTDWMGRGYAPQGEGRIYKIFDPDSANDPLVAEVKQLLTEGVKNKSADELKTLLGHADQRVRLKAQFELVNHGEASSNVFIAALDENNPPLARIHAIWGLAQIARAAKDVKLMDPVVALLGDEDAAIREQAARKLGDRRVAAAHDGLIKLIEDESPRVRVAAAMALGKLGAVDAIQPILGMLAAGEDKDPWLRHGGVMALTWIGENDPSAIIAAANHPSASARMGVLIALRRLGRVEVAQFLNAKEPQLVLEAARAINDAPIEDAMPQLATLLGGEEAVKLPEPVLHRVLNAHYRLGQAENAAALAQFAANNAAPEIMRIEAMTMLGMFDAPNGKDRVLGLWRPLETRDQSLAKDAMKPLLPEILLGTPAAPDEVRIAAIDLLPRIGSDRKDLLFAIVKEETISPAVGAAALVAMNEQDDPRIGEAVEIAMANGKGALREQAIRYLARRPDAPERLNTLLETGSIADQQAVYSALGTLEGNATAEEILSRSMDKLLAGNLAPELTLDLLDSATVSKNPAVQQKLQQYNEARPKGDPLAEYTETLIGGDAALGRKVFYEKAEVSCIRCHKIDGEGGIAGPDLSGIALTRDRQYLLSAIVDPNKDIAPGFENITIKMKAGRSYAGVVRSETEEQVVLDAGDGVVLHADKKEIDARSKGLSPMPQDVSAALSKRELRDVIEFLATLKAAPATQPAVAQQDSAPR